MSVTILTDNDFHTLTDGVNEFVIDFHATWCAPCKAFKPIYESASDDYESVRFFSVDVDENPELVKRYEIRAMPTLVYVKGDDLTKKTGAMSRAAFDAFLQLIP